MSVGILIDTNEKHIVREINCTITKQVVDTSVFGSSDLTELGQDIRCTMKADTQPKMFGIYELRIKEGPIYKRFQILSVRPTGKVFVVSGAKLSDESGL